MRKPNPILFFGVLAVLLASSLLLGADGAYADTLNRPDTTDDVGRYTSIALDGDGYPMIAYYDETNGDLMFLHCDDVNCAGDESANIVTLDSGNVTNWSISLQLDPGGYPVVAYTTRVGSTKDTALKLVHCGNADCSSGNTTQIVDEEENYTNGEFIFYYSSMVLDWNDDVVPEKDVPVFSYQIVRNGYSPAIVMARCAKDVDCSDPTYASLWDHPDLTDYWTGWGTSITLDDGIPVISFARLGTLQPVPPNWDVLVIRCGDEDCSAGNSLNEIGLPSSISRKASVQTAIQLDGSDYPIVAFQNDDLELVVVHCNDEDCAGDNESEEILDDIGPVGLYVSMTLDSSGYPVIAYHSHTFGDLKLLHCGNASCSSGNTTATVARDDHAGAYTAIQLNSSGYPVISHNHQDDEDLGVAVCDTTTCDDNDAFLDTDNDGCADDDEGTLGGTSSTVYDFADTPDLNGHRDRVITSISGGDGDVQRFLDRYGASGTFDADARWDIPTDTTSYHSAFDLNGDGTIDLANDILGAILQTGDDCN